MAITDLKIKSSDYTGKDVASAPDKLTGTAQENKAVFDRLKTFWPGGITAWWMRWQRSPGRGRSAPKAAKVCSWS